MASYSQYKAVSTENLQNKLRKKLLQPPSKKSTILVKHLKIKRNQSIEKVSAKLIPL